MKIIITHIDGISKVSSTARIKDKEVEFEYRFQKMSYCQTITLQRCIELGYIKKVKANNNFSDMKKDKIYPILKFYYAEDNVSCKKGDMIISIAENFDLHISNFEPAF